MNATASSAFYSKGIFVTGTDTNVGKTLVSSLIVSSLKAHSFAAGYFKPIQTGACSESPADLDTVVGFLALNPEERALSVYDLIAPMSPHRAAQLENKEVQIEEIQRYWQQLPHRNWVVEGAGGVLVPLNPRQTTRDLILALDLRVLLVASTRLGTINHTLLTLEAIESAGIPVAGIVLTGAEDPGLARSLQVFTATPILAEIPLLSSITPRAVQQLGPEYFSIPILNQIFCPLFRA